MNSRHQAEYCVDVALLLRHGTPLAEATGLIAAESGHGSVEVRIAEKVAAGEPLSRALEITGFPSWAHAAIGATEQTGKPADGLDLVARQLTREEAWRHRMASVTAYPVMVLGSSAIVGLALCRTILPTIASLTEELGSTPPVASQVALTIGRAGASPAAWVAAGALAAGCVWLIADQDRLRSAASRLPGLAEAIRWAEAWRYFGVLTTLVGASLPLDRALELAALSVTPKALRAGALDFARRVRAGDPPAVASRDVPWLPPRTARMLTVGAASGTLPQAFASLRDHAETALTRRLDALARWTPIVLLAIAALLIGFLTQALLMPAFQIDLQP